MCSGRGLLIQTKVSLRQAVREIQTADSEQREPGTIKSYVYMIIDELVATFSKRSRQICHLIAKFLHNSNGACPWRLKLKTSQSLPVPRDTGI